MELISPTVQVLEDQKVTLWELEWYGVQIAGIVAVTVVSSMLWKMVEATWS